MGKLKLISINGQANCNFGPPAERCCSGGIQITKGAAALPKRLGNMTDKTNGAPSVNLAKRVQELNHHFRHDTIGKLDRCQVVGRIMGSRGT